MNNTIEFQMSQLTRRLRLATMSAGIGIWDWNIENNDLAWDDGMYVLYNVDKWKSRPPFEWWLSKVHPGDKERVEKEIQLAVKGIRDYNTEFRIVWQDGSIHYIKGSGIVERDTAGNAVKMIGTGQDITAERTAEYHIRESEAKYRSFFENSIDGILLTIPGGEILAANPAACKMFQMTEEEICKAGRHGIVDAKDTLFHEFFKRRKSSGKATGEITFIRKDGSRFCGEQTSSIFKSPDGEERATTIIRDITIRKKSEKIIAENEAKYRALFENSQDAIVLTVTDGKILAANPAACAFFQMSEEEFCATERFDIVDATDERVHEFIKNRQANGQANGELRFVRKDGSIFDGEMHSTVFEDAYGEQRTSAIIRDITQRKITETSLIEAKQAAEAAKKAQEIFLSNMSHEIRTPMNGIFGMLQLIGDTTVTTEQRDYIETIKTSASNLLVIINDILDINKIIAGKITFEEIVFEVKDVIDHTIKINKQKAKDKGIALQCDIDSTIPHHLVTDTTRLNQILLNLISNAIKFTDEGEVRVSVKKLRETETNAFLQFSVSDTGIGISADNINSIFESFVQSNNTITRKYGGTGLGLTISKQLIELMGGTIKVSSELGKGSSFVCEMPFKKGVSEGITVTIAKDPVAKKSLEGIRILVAEDNAINQRVAQITLQKWGAMVDIAENGQIAIDMFTRQPYDIILMDIQMPAMDGLQATEYIRTQVAAPFNTVPIIAMTAAALVSDKEIYLKGGMNDYISKPFKSQDLYEKIQHWAKKDK